MIKILSKTILLLGSMLLILPAMAGKVQPAPVELDLENLFAGGDMVSARTAKDDDVFIGCGTRNIEDGAGGLFSWAFCQAGDENGEAVTCFTQNPDLVRTIREINDHSYITFSWTDDGEGNLTCTRMGFSTQSFYIGKEVKGNKVKKDKDDDD